MVNQQEEEYEEDVISPGDQFYMIEDMNVATFVVKGPHGNSYRSIVTLRAGDIITYLRREKMRFGIVPMYLFVFLAEILDNDGSIVKEIKFMVKNPDSLIKWTADY